MKISYNWLKWYIPEAPDAEKLADIFTHHVCEVETVEKKLDGDFIFDIKILPNRAHDLLSHQGVARETSSLLNINFIDPTPKYKIPKSKTTDLKIKIKTDKCRRYMGRIVRGIKVGPSPEWVVRHLESIGQRSINNVVDVANIVMFDCGQPIHCFDLDKLSSGNSILVRDAKDGEEIITLDNKKIKLKSDNIIIAEIDNVLAIAGVKGGKVAEVDSDTKNIIIEIANFDPTSVRKTARELGFFTDAVKRFENDLSPELCDFAMMETSALMVDVGNQEHGEELEFEEVVDIYPIEQKERKISFSTSRISKILGINITLTEVEDILKRYNFIFINKDEKFEIIVPPMRLDLNIEEDMAEEVGRILGYDKIKAEIPKIDFKPRINETYAQISWARNKLLEDGYSEVVTYIFVDKGEVEVMESTSDKKFLRTNLSDGLKESLKLNQTNSPLLEINKVKIFEIGTVFKKKTEEVMVAYGDKNGIKEVKLKDFFSSDTLVQSSKAGQSNYLKKNTDSSKEIFSMWSLFPFIARDIAVWVPETVSVVDVMKVIKENTGELAVKGPELFDEFKKDGKISYAFRIVFQSYDRTLTDIEINETMIKITNKIKENNAWQVR